MLRVPSLTLLAAIAALTAAPALAGQTPLIPAVRPPAPPGVVALLPLRALGAKPDAVAALQETLRNEMAQLPEITLAPADAVTAALRRESDCLSRLSCAAEAATRAGARQLVSGTVSELGDSYMIDLKLVDARSGQELRRVTHPVSGREDALIELLRATAVELLAPARFVGRLSVKLLGEAPEVVAPEVREQARLGKGAQLFLDGRAVGTLPLAAPLTGVPVGQHTLRVAQEGFHDATLFVEVRYDRTTEAFVDLERGSLAGVAFLREKESSALPAPPLVAGASPKEPAPAQAVTQAPPRGPWLKIGGWSGAGVGALALAAAGILQAKAYATASALNKKESQNQLSQADLVSYDDLDKEVTAARVLYTAGAILAAGGGAILLWDHHLEEARGAKVSLGTAGSGVLLSARF